MSFSNAKITVRKSLQNDPFSARYMTLCDAPVIPVFCVCLIAAMGSLSGFNHVVRMQFSVDADTEYIEQTSAMFFYTQLNNTENNFYTNH